MVNCQFLILFALAVYDFSLKRLICENKKSNSLIIN